MDDYKLKYDQQPKKWTTKKIIFVGTALLAIVGAVIALIMLYVVAPRTAQAKLDASVIQVKGVKLYDVSNNKFKMEMTSLISSEDDAVMDAFDVTAFYKDEELGKFKQAETKTAKGENIINQAGEFQITNQKAFEKYAADMLQHDALEWRLQGTTGITAKGMHFGNLKFDKKIKLPGIFICQVD
jgi:hypothetical protein